MSINITVHGSPVNLSKRTNILVNNECARKEEIEKRRKLRLEQVRQKSKEIASQLRQNLGRENKRQLERIDKIKNDELLKWRQKAAAQAKSYYEKTLENVGLAHRAAQQEQHEKLQPCVQTKNSFRTKKSIPSKSKTHKAIATTAKTTKKHFKTLPSLSYQKKHKHASKKCRINDENSSNIANAASTVISKHNTSKFVKISSEAKRRFDEISSVSSNDIITSPLSSPNAVPKLQKSPRKIHKPQKIAQTPSIIMAINSESDSSPSSLPLDIEDTHDSSNMHYSRMTSKFKSPSSSPSRARRRCRNTRKELISSIPTQEIRFTQISDLIRQKNRENEEHLRNEPSRECLKTRFDGNHHVTRTTSLSPKKCERTPLRSPRKSVKSTPSSPKRPQEAQIQNIQLSPRRQKAVATDTRTVVIGTTSPKRSLGSQASHVASKKSEKTSLKSSIKSSGTLSQQPKQQQLNGSSRVQFYDYGNKFEKLYEPPKIVQIENIPCGLNAMEQAEIETELQEHRQMELDIARTKSDERCQRALEREQIRRDYEALTAKLDAISKDKNMQKKFNGNAYLFSDVRIKNAEEQRQKKLNSEIQSILKRPTLITCKEIQADNKLKPDINYSSQQLQKNLSDLNLADHHQRDIDDDISYKLNSSDSCTSILLNYVSDETKKLTHDIANCDSIQKIKQLQKILNKINNLRQKLIDEMKNCKKDVSSPSYSRENLQEVVNSIESVQKEREKIMRQPRRQKMKESLKKDANKQKMQEKIKKEEKLARREEELKRKEVILEKKLRDLYKKNETIEKDKYNEECNTDDQSTSQMEITDLEQDESTDTLKSKKIIAEKPIEIVIKVKNQTRDRTPIKSPFKLSKKRSNSIGGVKRRQIPKSPQIKYPKEVLQLQIHQQEDGNTTITSYHSPPQEMHTSLSHVLDAKHLFDTAKDSHRDKTECVRDRYEIQKQTAPPTKATQPKAVKIHPQVTHYIQRLLGMSHHAIEMLGVSTSEFETPSSSIINKSANISVATESDSFERTKIERLKKFIQDNYKFLDEVDESLKKDTSTTSSDSSSAIKTIERIWKQTLKESQHEREKAKTQIKPILKKVKTPKRSTLQTMTMPSTNRVCQSERLKSPARIASVPVAISPRIDRKKSIETKMSALSNKEPTRGAKKVELLGRYNDLAEHCTLRIAELNEMITKVREEKQKILEITLSSGGDTARTSTEYADFCENQAFDRSGSSKMSDKKVMSPLVRSPEKVSLEKNKLTGISRDSGISLSRPVTALDSRESPDIPSSMQEDFVPILKDIPKPSAAEMATVPTVQIIPPFPQSMGIIDGLIVCAKPRKEKPPATLGRYSPQFGDELQLPHELSTIVEVDTPATSRLNTSVTDRQTVKTPTAKSLLETEKTINEIAYQKFPSFHEYAKQNKLDFTTFDQNTISQIQIGYQELVSKIEKSHETIENSEISDSSDEIRNLVESMRFFNHSFKKFPTRKDYLEERGISDSVDSKSLDEDRNKNSTDAKIEAVGSVESLLDVIKELKRRNMLQNSFQYEVPEKLESKTSENDDITESTTTSSSNHNREERNLLKPPTEKLIHHTNKPKFPIEDTNVLSGIEMIPATTASSQSTDDIGKDLEKMGLTWAATMMKKSQENRREFASTTSSSVSSKKILSQQKSRFDEISKAIKQELSDITNDSIDLNTGRPLNLREFLAKELKKRTTASSSISSSSLNGSSITSRFLQSLLGSTGSGSSLSKLSNRETMKSTDRVKTSTPVNTRSSSKSPSSSHHSAATHNSAKFFSGDSHPSSVHYHSSNRSQSGESDGSRGLKKTQSQSS